MSEIENTKLQSAATSEIVVQHSESRIGHIEIMLQQLLEPLQLNLHTTTITQSNDININDINENVINLLMSMKIQTKKLSGKRPFYCQILAFLTFFLAE